MKSMTAKLFWKQLSKLSKIFIKKLYFMINIALYVLCSNSFKLFSIHWGLCIPLVSFDRNYILKSLDS